MTSVLACALVLTGCTGGGEEPAADEAVVSSAAPAADAAVTTTEEPRTGEAAGDPLTRWLTPVELEDPPRALTELERTLLHEPGPFAQQGDTPSDALLSDTERERAAAAAAALGPQTEEEWIGAVLAQVHGDYVQDVRDTVFFDTGTGDGSAAPTAGPPEAQPVGTNHYALVLDASGSMEAAGSAGTRMEEAKAAIEAFVEKLPEGSTVSLRVYGHEGSNDEAGKAESCASSEVVFDGQSSDRDGLAGALEDVVPVGYTPLARAIDDARGDIPEQATDSIVYVVTDGLETCGGDPVAAAQALAGTDVRPVVNVIGFQTGDADQAALAAIAQAGGGEFTAAGSGAELDAYWEEERRRMQAAWAQWRQEEASRITRAGEANKVDANAVGERIKTTSNVESQAGKDVVRELERQGLLDSDTSSAVWQWFSDRSSPIWSYGNDTASENWVASDDQADADRAALYEQADRSWSEFYRGDGG
ncbi:VWA domain-containing protein [Ornithinimicrobium pekingense]|nr:VWA domain-containing protein [Ornithinimicrobium pekingense]